jgi:fructose-1,6-bisphosphatase/inositol monophosphatase family enzyme
MMGLLPQLQQASVMNLLSIGYMGAKVATGEFAATVFPGGNAHDNAAIHLLVEEAGGRFTDLFGNAPDYSAPLKGHIAANPALHEKLLALVRSFNANP